MFHTILILFRWISIIHCVKSDWDISENTILINCFPKDQRFSIEERKTHLLSVKWVRAVYVWIVNNKCITGNKGETNILLITIIWVTIVSLSLEVGRFRYWYNLLAINTKVLTLLCTFYIKRNGNTWRMLSSRIFTSFPHDFLNN